MQQAFTKISLLPRYAAMGIMRREDLRRAREHVWLQFAREYDEVPASFTLMPWEEEFYDRFLKLGDRVLVVGCGSGRDLVPLSARGYRVEGLDVVEASVEMARRNVERRGYGVPLYVGDIETVTIPGTFDVFVFSWFCYSYILGSANRIAVLRRVSACLSSDGRILISYIRLTGLPRRLPHWIARAVAGVSRSDWLPERGDVILLSGPAMDSVSWQHCFVKSEIEAEARAAGLAATFHGTDKEGPGLVVLTRPSSVAPAGTPS